MITTFTPTHPDLNSMQVFGRFDWDDFARWVIYNLENYSSPEQVTEIEMERVSCIEDENEVHYELVTVDGKQVGHLSPSFTI